MSNGLLNSNLKAGLQKQEVCIVSNHLSVLQAAKSCMCRRSYSFSLPLNPINSKETPELYVEFSRGQCIDFQNMEKAVKPYEDKKMETYIIDSQNFPQQIFPRNKVRKINYLLNKKAIISLASFMYCFLHCITFQNLKYPKAQSKVQQMKSYRNVDAVTSNKNNFRDNIGKIK